ncbi:MULTISPECIES: amino acid synthesis family protein [unclassified Pseudoclavibacter]|uniref:amino acid synthesis family protein n=1 Tax=unclassified Pseudoclavibacter TaxID=2615177 RepID=UPI001BA86063|nr:amino acid synthesis family protein [Pseudoclavibacter sp. Marseille-Q4354]MBS3178319.1 amino acid synthesis family protein [Pseudoclavibacter sp. Marseille-Q4354]
MTTTVTATEQHGDALLERAVALGVRKIFTAYEDVISDGGVDAPTAIRQASAVAVVRNPWIGQGKLADLTEATAEVAPVVAKLLSDRLLAALGGAGKVEAFGKAAVVGLEGEIEHAGALIHTPYFGNLLREFLEGTSIICFSDTRADAGGDLRVPLWHKTAAATRSHYQSLDVHLADAPHRDEIAVIAVASSGPRPHPRIGDRTTDVPVTSDILKGITA